jgi:GT2 family glycosyltransferase
VVESGWLSELVKYCEAHPEVGSAQSKLLLHPRTTTINTMGNNSHFLGFGFPTGYQEEDGQQFAAPHAINYASGAGVIVRAELLEQVGLFEDEMFMYLEDADLSWKVKQLGYEVHVVPASRVYHKYKFNKGYRFYYELERNRWWLLLVYYKAATLCVLAPALAMMEMGQWLSAAKQGRMLDKLRSYAFFWRPANIRRIWQLRRAAQRRRKIPDRQFLREFKGKIVTPELKGVLVNYVANPIFAAYWAVAKRLIWW